MSLGRLKKQLKQELKQDLKAQKAKKRKNKRKNKRLRWVYSALLVVVLLTAGGYYGFLYRSSSAPQFLLERGAKQEARLDPLVASQTYQKIVALYPRSQQAEEALFRTARIWQYDRDDERRALLTYMTLEHDYPQSSLVITAQEEAARIYKYSLQDYSRAIVYYQRLYNSGGAAAVDYLYEIADCYFQLENYPQAYIELEDLLEHFPDSDRVAEVLLREGELALLEKRYAVARSTWQRLIDEHPQNSYRFEVKYKLAGLQEEQGQLYEALEAYRNIDNFPRPALLKEKIEYLEKRIAAKDKVK
jgi:tetratricopeptide (TPR) repeat protein